MACSLSTFELGASMGRLSSKNSPMTGSARPLTPWRPSTLPSLKPSVLSCGSSVAPSPFCTFLVDLILIVLTTEQTLTRQTRRAPAVKEFKCLELRSQLPVHGEELFQCTSQLSSFPNVIAHLDT